MEPWKLEPARDLGLPPGERMRSLSRESGLISTAAHLTWWGFVHAALRVYHRLEVHGRENLPTAPPFVMIANHSSHLDAMVLAAPLSWRLRDRVFPVAAGDVFFESSLRSVFAATFLNALPMWRRNCGRHALRQLRQRLLDEPCGYILFPEGSRSRDGRLLAFKEGLGMLIAGAEVPIIPCYIDGANHALPPGAFVPRCRKIRLTVGPALRLTDLTNDRDGWRQITAILRQQIIDLSEGKLREVAADPTGAA